MRFATVPVPIALALLLLVSEAPAAAAKPESDDVSPERGHALAVAHCARCHDLSDGKSPRTAAPNFANVRVRYSHDALVSELQAIGQRGHFEMHPVYLNPTEIRDIVAYVDTVR